MAQRNKDLLSRLADRGEQVVGRITDLPGAKNLLDRTTALAKRVDEMQKHLRSLAPLDKRVTQIERRLDKIEGKSPARKRTTRRTTTGAAKRASSAKRSTASRRTPRRRPPSSS